MSPTLTEITDHKRPAPGDQCSHLQHLVPTSLHV